MSGSEHRGGASRYKTWEPSAELQSVEAAWWRVLLRSALGFVLCIGLAAGASWLTDEVSGWFGILFVAAFLGAFVAWGYAFIVGGNLKWRELRMRREERAAWRARS